MITPAGGAAASDGGASPLTASTTTAMADKELFLQLMVAQLRNQDPLNPTDSAEFLAQTAQFTSLEKLEKVADQTAQSLAAQMAFGASSLVGRNITYLDPDGAEANGAVGSVRFTADGPLLTVGEHEIPLADVVTVTS